MFVGGEVALVELYSGEAAEVVDGGAIVPFDELGVDDTAPLSSPSHPASVAFCPAPITPPVTPAAENLASASLCVSHAILVPAFFTSGSTTQVVPAAQGVSAQAPETHCAKEPVTQACWSPGKMYSAGGRKETGRGYVPLHGEEGVRVENSVFRA
jgi:hypothetical protein